MNLLLRIYAVCLEKVLHIDYAIHQQISGCNTSTATFLLMESQPPELLERSFEIARQPELPSHVQSHEEHRER